MILLQLLFKANTNSNIYLTQTNRYSSEIQATQPIELFKIYIFLFIIISKCKIYKEKYIFQLFS